MLDYLDESGWVHSNCTILFSKKERTYVRVVQYKEYWTGLDCFWRENGYMSHS